jgi:transposase
MRADSVQQRDLAAAQRALIVQRVLVEGWTPEEAGAPFGVDGRSVARWVAAYQRQGMSALRGEAAIAKGARRWIEACRAWIALVWIGEQKRGGILKAKRPSAWRSDRGGTPEDPTRRWCSY